MRDSGSLRMGEMELRGRVCAGKNCGLGNVTSLSRAMLGKMQLYSGYIVSGF